MRLSIDTPNVNENNIPADLNRWFTTLTDNLNYIFCNIVASRTVDIGSSGAGPLEVLVSGMTVDSIVIASIQSSTNAVEIQKVTAKALGFDILLSSDPGASCFINYVAFLSPVEAIGV